MSHGEILGPDSAVDSSINGGPPSEPHQFIPTIQGFPPRESANRLGNALDSTMMTVAESRRQILPQDSQIALPEYLQMASAATPDGPSRTSSPEIEDLANPLPQALTSFEHIDSPDRAENSLQDEGEDGGNHLPLFRLKLHPTFQALPLLSDDLPFTTITISHSFVRVNNWGNLKRVLSFSVFVDPGNGKDGWKVQKTYSHILVLDQRIRKAGSMSVGKKISSLPEEKLWKDLAPAMLDQGKMLINLPVNNNDEVIAFFTSNIIREMNQPVMQNGHKEDYLTKRGKNFGGWKVRYFVMQGPVLEYYEHGGGAHLGSIQITCAQIGRQLRDSTAANTNENREYRHALLIVETTKGGAPIRHVLCAESDEERDAWVEVLVRYFHGTYNDKS